MLKNGTRTTNGDDTLISLLFWSYHAHVFFITGIYTEADVSEKGRLMHNVLSLEAKIP